MAYLHVLRAASRLLDPGATYSHRGAVGLLDGGRAVIRLVYLDRATPGAAREPWWTRVELALGRGAPVGLSIHEAEGDAAALVRSAWADDVVDVEDFDVRFRIARPTSDAPEPFPSRALRERMLHHPPSSVHVVAEVRVEDGADPMGTTDGTDARRHLGGAPVLVVEAPGICESADLEGLVLLATSLRGEL